MIASLALNTDRLIVAPFTEELLTETYVSWLNDPKVVQNSGQRHTQHTLQECREYFLSFKNSSNLFFSIKLRDNKKHIGNITVTVDAINSVADIAILIGDTAEWGKGYGLEAWKTICHFLLEEKKIRKITGGCYNSNENMKKIMIKTGMQFDGIRCGQVLVNAQPVDIVYFALFNSHWNPSSEFL